MNSSTIRCVITAGPTREHLDPVRYFSNGSSGRMGYRLAEASKALGWNTLLVSGPSSLAAPEGVDVVRVISAEEMRNAVSEVFDECDVLIMCAAVADYRPVERTEQKVKKASSGRLQIEMEPTPDILAEMGKRKRNQLLLGFAAETERHEEHAKEKLARKNLDWIVANPVSGEQNAMESDYNEITMLARDGRRFRFGPALKAEVAQFILKTLGTEVAHGES